MSRIGIIREAIVAVGGNSDFIYYADNTEKHRKRDGDAIYKVPKWQDGLTGEQRSQVVETLKQNPDVKDAYLSRGFNERRWDRTYRRVEGGHIKVRFYGLARPWK